MSGRPAPPETGTETSICGSRPDIIALMIPPSEPPVMWISHTPEHNWLQTRLEALGVRVTRCNIEDGDVWWLGRHNELVMSELKTTNDFLTTRHSGGLNCLFWDNHVKWMRPEQACARRPDNGVLYRMTIVADSP